MRRGVSWRGALGGEELDQSVNESRITEEKA